MNPYREFKEHTACSYWEGISTHENGNRASTMKPLAWKGPLRLSHKGTETGLPHAGRALVHAASKRTGNQPKDAKAVEMLLLGQYFVGFFLVLLLYKNFTRMVFCLRVCLCITCMPGT